MISGEINIKARAKINLSLDVDRKRSDGYHDIRTIMQTLDLHDNIKLEVIKKGIEIKCNSDRLPLDNRNIAYRVADMLLKECKIESGVRITIDKNIPIAAGLAGGSSDAAAVFKGINELFNCGLDLDNLMSLGKILGADIPYCLKGGTVLAEGIGEVLTELRVLPTTNILLVVPKVSISTKWVYQNLNLDQVSQRPDMDLLKGAINRGNIRLLAENMINVLETVTIEKYDVINKIKKKLRECGALGSLMSGSGPSVFGIFKDKGSALNAYQKINCNEWLLFITETV